MALYRDMDRAALDAAYDNSRAVANSAELLAGFQARSDRLRRERPQHLDLRYGPAERNRIDYFAAATPGPVLVFIHGGYWQMRAKETFAFLAEGPRAHGIHVALVGYTLAPEQTLSGIVAEVRAAVAWTRRARVALITRSILLQVIAEQEQSGRSILSAGMLRHIIRFYGNPLQEFMAQYLETAVESFLNQQKGMQDQFREFLAKTPMATMQAMTAQVSIKNVRQS